MAENTKIEWCDATFNPWIGCTKVSPGCDHCYAECSTPTRVMHVAWGADADRRRTSESNWQLPLRWNKQAQLHHEAWHAIKAQYPHLNEQQLYSHGVTKPHRPRVFCSSLADVFDNAVDPKWRADLFELIRKTPFLDWLLLTKRVGNVAPMLAQLQHPDEPGSTWLDKMPLPNVWIGATVVNQQEADRDIPKLLSVPAAVRFLSMEPLLGPVDLTTAYLKAKLGQYPFKGLAPQHRTTLIELLDWVIVGGESGPHARPMQAQWVRSLQQQCRDANVPFLFKQWGEWMPDSAQEGTMVRVGKKTAGRLLDGSVHHQFPVLR